MPTADLTPVFRSLADPTRRALFEQVMDRGEVTIGALAEKADISQPAISQHFRTLRRAGLVAERREGRHVYYTPNENGLVPLIDWLAHYGIFWRERFTNLRKVLKEIDP